jgi:hypothetical protein
MLNDRFLQGEISCSHCEYEVFWDVALKSVVEIDGRFKGVYCLHQAIYPMMEAVVTSEMAVPWLRLLIVCLSPLRPGSTHVRFMVDKWQWGRFICEFFGFALSVSLHRGSTLIL